MASLQTIAIVRLYMRELLTRALHYTTNFIVAHELNRKMKKSLEFSRLEYFFVVQIEIAFGNFRDYNMFFKGLYQIFDLDLFHTVLLLRFGYEKR